MTSIDDALQKAYARRGQPTARRRSGGPHIRPMGPVAPPQPEVASPASTPLPESTRPISTIRGAADDATMSSPVLPMIGPATPITVRFEPSHDETGATSIGSFVYAPTLELPASTLPITSPAPGFSELSARRPRVDCEAVAPPAEGPAAQLPLAKILPDTTNEPLLDDAPDGSSHSLPDRFSYEVLTSDPTLNTWHLPDDSIVPRGVTIARSVTSLPDQGMVAEIAALPTHAEAETSTEVELPLKAAVVRPEDPAVVETTPELPVSTASSVIFKAAWEVDNFGFPELCTRAMDELRDQIRDAVNTLIQETLPQRPVVSIGSWLRGEGRSTVGMLLARALSMAGLRVALIDADFENPRLAEHLGLSLDGGWDPATVHDADLAECCVFSVEDRFTLLPLNPGSEMDELSARQTLNPLIDRLISNFQIILVDNGPGSAALTQIGGQGRDVKLIVRDTRETSDESLDRLVNRLQRQDEGPIFVIENYTTETPWEAQIG